jgi:hypothetical protein
MTDIERAFASVCKKCMSDPCQCHAPMVKQQVADVCTVCRRHVSACICVSHHEARQLNDAVLPGSGQRPIRPWSDAYMQAMVNEALGYYYNRDADGLSKWLKRVLR